MHVGVLFLLFFVVLAIKLQEPTQPRQVLQHRTARKPSSPASIVVGFEAVSCGSDWPGTLYHLASHLLSTELQGYTMMSGQFSRYKFPVLVTTFTVLYTTITVYFQNTPSL